MYSQRLAMLPCVAPKYRVLAPLLLGVCLCWTVVGWTQAAEPAAPRVVNPNGGWSWFGDERAVVDAERNLLYVGSLANHAGQGGKAKDGDVEVTRIDLTTGEKLGTDVLHHALLSYGGGDDHNCPSLLVLPEGRCLAAYAGHNNGPTTYLRTFDPATETWSDERTFDWNAAIPGGCDFGCTYNNLFYLPDSKQVVNISRNHHRCPNVIVSNDLGETWQYAGQLVRPAAARDATGFYVNGYLKYTQQQNRIELLATERHPRSFSNSLYHGYLEGGALHRADGAVVDPTLDTDPQADATELTQLFAAGTELDSRRLTHGWMIDFEHYDQGRLATVFKARVNESVEEHYFLYGLYDGTEWQVHSLAPAGPRLFTREEDYTGLAALDPNDPSVVYISSPIDPSTQKTTSYHEIYRGQTTDQGRTWTWQAVTTNSTCDNLRPIIPRWKPGRTALLWTAGSMESSQNYDLRVLLLVDPLKEDSGR